jgi:hypothetical protein
VESDAALIDSAREEAIMAAAAGIGERRPVLTYLVNSISAGDRTIPYSLVTATELDTIVPGFTRPDSGRPPIILNEWAARDLGAKPGQPITLEYFVWEDPGRLASRSASFTLERVVPLSGAAADRDLAPVFPGITEADTLTDWDPPFPIDLRRIRPIDEDYWKQYRTTPKAFIPELDGRVLWRSRYGELTSIRVATTGDASLASAGAQLTSTLRDALDPATTLAVRPVRADGLSASRGATDFGEYFTYFSFFLVVSAILLASLFFKLGVEQRGREVGLLRAVGFSTRDVRRLFTIEAVLLAAGGGLVGVLGALGYAGLLMAGLRTWWVEAVGTTALSLHVTPVSLAAGALGGMLAAVACIWWTLRSLARISERGLLAGQLSIDAPGRAARGLAPASLAIVLLLLGLALVGAGLARMVGQAGAFFGAAAALLGAALAGLTAWLQRPPARPLTGSGVAPVARLGARNAAFRPARSVLSVAVVAFAAFILFAVDAFRKDAAIDASIRQSGTGGYTLLVDTMLPVVHDLNSEEARETFGLADLEGVSVTPFRVLPGDDASCLNLYEPRQPRIIAAPPGFLREGRFRFAGVLDESPHPTDAERSNPWLLLERDREVGDDGTEIVPVAVDANSMTYVLHKRLGDEIAFTHNGRPIRMRLVAALSDSLLQGELVMSDANFLRLFPEEDGFRFFLVDAPPDRMAAASTAIEDRLSDFGADARSTAERLAEFHRVENTYLSTFQTLGGLGLLLGTVGLAAILLRNVLERRRELALLSAVGYGPRRIFAIVIAESLLLLCLGLLVGVVCALVAVAPVALERGGALPTGTTAWALLGAVLAAGVASSWIATRAAMSTPLLTALRSE